MTSERLAVGDVGVVRYRDPYAPNAKRADRAAKVTKVGRRWATVVDTSTGYRIGQFDIDTGWANSGGGIRVPHLFLTPEREAALARLDAARGRVRAARLRFDVGSLWSDDDVVALADWLDERFGPVSP